MIYKTNFDQCTNILSYQITVFQSLSNKPLIYIQRVCSLPAEDMNANLHICGLHFVSCEGCVTCPCKECVRKCKVISIECTIGCTISHMDYLLFDICYPPSSAGVGRTGTFIAVDAMMQRLKEKDDLNIYNFVTQMRTKRTFMVQNLVCRPTVYRWAI